MYKIAAVIVGLVIVGGGAAYYFNTHRSLGTACTAEALLCPDGSAVGRTGPECKFSACPGIGPWTGKLEQSSGGFRLILASPAATGQEVAYAMPLNLKVSNALADFLGQKVRVFGNFSEGNTFEVDRLEGVGQDITLGDVKVGETAFINGVRLTLNKIVSDSRCPAGVQCIWAGSVVASVSLKSDTDAETRNIESGKPPVGFDSFLISLVDVKPGYVLTFKVAPTSVR